MNYKKIGSSTQLTALRDGWRTVSLTVSVMLVGMEIYPTLNLEETAVLWLPPRIPPCRLYLRFLKVCLVSYRRSTLRAPRKGMYVYIPESGIACEAQNILRPIKTGLHIFTCIRMS